MKKLLFLVVLVFIVALQSNLFSIPLDSAGNNKLLWEQNFNEYNVLDCAFMPDENYIIHTYGPKIQIRRTIDQFLVKEMIYNSSQMTSIDISYDKKYLAIAGSNVLLVLDPNTLDTIYDFKPNFYTRNVKISRDNKKLLSSANGLKVFDLSTQKEIFAFGNNTIYLSEFSPDGKFLACCYSDGTDKKIYVFDTDSFKLWATFNDDYEGYKGFLPQRILFSPDSKYLIGQVCGGFTFRVYDVLTKTNYLNENLEKYKAGNGKYIFIDNHETIFWSTGYPDEGSYFYNIKQKLLIKHLSDFAPPIYANPVFNSNQTLLLGDRLCLSQFDASVLSVDNHPVQNDALLIPNPTNGVVTIRLSLPFSYPVQVKIIGIDGSIAYQFTEQNFQSGLFEHIYDASHLTNGTYLVTISQKNYSQTLKLIKE